MLEKVTAMTRYFLKSVGICLVSLSLACSCAPVKSEVKKERQDESASSFIPSYISSNAAPMLLPGTAFEMTTPGFWIGIHPEPDRTVIPASGIPGFNRSIRFETGMVQDISSYAGTVRGADVSAMLRNDLRYLASRKYVRQDGCLADSQFFKGMEESMALSAITSRVNVRFAIVTSYTDQRLLPTGTELYSNIKSIDIDRLQNSSLDIGTPLAVFHSSRDGSWLYAITPLSEGWVKAEHVGFCSRGDLGLYLESDPFVVTTNIKTDLFLDDSLRVHLAYARMGSRFPARDTEDESAYEIQIPVRNEDGQCAFREAYVAGGDVSKGYLPYTPRTIILQAFKLLNSPYGWGDKHGEQDCSRFIEEVFSTVGIQLPRNSLQQAKVGRLIASFNNSVTEEKRLSVLSDNSYGGISILHMNGHIMLFLGCVGGAPYAIHDMRGYAEPTPDGELLMMVNRVVVSSLRLGEGTRSGPFLKRLVTVRAFEKKSS
jgi:hypothetical protein